MKKSESTKKLYLLILIISSITSYIILAIDKSEVFSYIYEENRLYLLDTVRLIFLVSLVFIFILIYYASFYMISEKKNDIGLYVAEGMSQSNLFRMLFKDSLGDLIKANFLGLGISIFINEFINLLTVKILSLGLNYHKFSLSIKAVIFTLLISLILNSLSIYTIVRDFYKKNPDEIFRGEIKSRSDSFLFLGLVLFLLGIVFARPYYRMEFFLIIGFTSMFLLLVFFVISKIFLKTKKGDLIVRKSLSLSFKNDKASLLFTSFMLIIGTLILAYTLITSISSRNALERPADFTLYDSEEKIQNLKQNQEMAQMIGEIYPIYGYEYDNIDTNEIENLVRANISLDRTSRNDFYLYTRFLLRKSTFEKIYDLRIELASDEAIILTENENQKLALEDTMSKEELFIKISDKSYKILPIIESNRIFSNDVIGLSSMVVLDDDIYDSLIGNKNPFAYNLNLSKDFVNSFGFSKGSDMLREAFIRGGYKYESYIWQAKNAISQITENLYTYFYLSLIFILAGLSFFTIRIFILFEKSKEKLKILSLMGLSLDEIKAMVKKEYTILFLTVGLSSILISVFLFMNLPYTAELFFKLTLSKIGFTLSMIGLSLIILMTLFLRFIIRISFERIVYYEENINN
ncbi:FtsX-like permease family protein [uncultured Anaerococcus sp.]|uniref:FtsX-like permease family protein n=1 Tax=uncultured Anaerococcus sp. TaxID=293428 RepID=UPI00262352B2|nr:FtsX-like permease family protein [uncultured Anaerococcus sp.]